MNKVIMSGNLGKDPEVRYTTGAEQQAMCTFSLAVNEKTRNGQETTWFNVVAFGKTAENCGKYLSKGKKALVEGKIQVRQYDKQDGTKGTSVDIVAYTVEFMTPKDEGQQMPQQGQSFTPAQGFQNEPQYVTRQQYQQEQQQQIDRSGQYNAINEPMQGFLQTTNEVPF